MRIAAARQRRRGARPTAGRASRCSSRCARSSAIPGSKNACEQGECGSCSVLLDGVLVCACLVLAAQADGHDVTTVEGLADGDELHPVQEAFVEAGAVQCGFCTPGLVVAAADLLERTPGPVRRRDPRGALRQPLPLHRLREDLRRGQAWRAQELSHDDHEPARRQARGRPHRRARSRAPTARRRSRASSRTRATSSRPGCSGATRVRSPHAHARIVSIDITEAVTMPGVHAVLTHDDVPGEKTLRPRVPRPARARDRPRPLLRRAGRARRGRASRAGAPRGREDPRRVRAARARHRHGARDRAARSSTPSSRRSGHGYRDDARPNVVRTS